MLSKKARCLTKSGKKTVGYEILLAVHLLLHLLAHITITICLIKLNEIISKVFQASKTVKEQPIFKHIISHKSYKNYLLSNFLSSFNLLRKLDKAIESLHVSLSDNHSSASLTSASLRGWLNANYRYSILWQHILCGLKCKPPEAQNFIILPQVISILSQSILGIVFTNRSYFSCI